MKKFQFLLLDAGPIIKLFELGLWENFIDKCNVTICRTVAEDELVYYEVAGDKKYIDYALKSYEDRIEIKDVDLSTIKTFRKSIPVFYGIDPGEEETLALMFSSTEEWEVCTSDKAVLKLLGYFGKSEQGISLEEVFKQVGYSNKLEWKYTERFREKYTEEGQIDKIQG